MYTMYLALYGMLTECSLCERILPCKEIIREQKQLNMNKTAKVILHHSQQILWVFWRGDLELIINSHPVEVGSC